MSQRSRNLIAFALLLAVGAACWQQRMQAKSRNLTLQPVAAPTDLGQVAYRHVEKLCSFGERYTGSVGWRLSTTYIYQQLKELGLKPTRDRWRDPKEGLDFCNVLVTIPGKSKDRILIGCHHDTKKCKGHKNPEHNFTFIGANDSGSGVGLLLALARSLAAVKDPDVTYELVFFDGEESVPFVWDIGRALFGSRRYVRNYIQDRIDKPELPKVRAFVLLDMVGAKDLHIDDEENSDRKLHNIFRAAARAAGHGAYFFEHAHKVTDDHIPFIEDTEIPCIDLIDLWDNPEWHTSADTLEHISAQSLHIVGEVVLTALPELERQYFPERRPQ